MLFDKDGTLIDFNATWLPACRLAARRVAEFAGDPELADVLMRLGGWDAGRGAWQPNSLLTSASNAEIIENWAAAAGVHDARRIESLVLDTFYDCAVSSAVCIEGIHDLFASLSARGLSLGVATMDDERTARATLAGIGLDRWLDFVCGADSGFGTKPGPGMLEAFCRHVGIRPDEVVMIGDSPHDLNMGRRAGAGLVVGVLSGTHGADELAPLADHVVEDATGLIDLIVATRTGT